MDLRYVRTFVTIAEAGSIARAHGRLSVSQPAASRQVLALETELGVRLFDRIGRRLRLTSEGEDLLRQCRRLLVEADSLGARAGALKGGETGILRVGATPQTIEHTLSGFLDRYRRRHPGVEVHFVEDGGSRLPGRLEHGDVHVAVFVDLRFRYRLLYPAYCLAVMSTKSPFGRRRAIDIAELANEPVLLLNRGYTSREWFDAACGVERIRPLVLLESAAPHTLIELARTGYGIAVVPSNVAVPPGVRAAPLVQRGIPIGRWLNVSWDPRRSLAAYAEQFVDELVAHCLRDYPNRDLARRAPPLPKPKNSAN
jgi:LysR family transcriptional regulator, cyn operon transcriptional activator